MNYDTSVEASERIRINLKHRPTFVFPESHVEKDLLLVANTIKASYSNLTVEMLNSLPSTVL